MEKNSMYRNLRGFQMQLRQLDKSPVTVQKYVRDAAAFVRFAGERPVSRMLILDYRQYLMELGYTVRSVNSMLAGLNSFLDYLGIPECRVKNLKRQQEIYCPEEKELSRAEYVRLLEAAKGQEQLYLVMQTICGTGIRVSELRYFTVEAVRRGQVQVRCKSKTRTVFIPGKLRKLLLAYAKKRKLRESIFVTRSGKPLDRSNIWASMKRLCAKAGVMPTKVFPHNLRKLFARTFYGIERDIAKLADILGHGSIETTRIYIMSTGEEHRRKIERMHLIL